MQSICLFVVTVLTVYAFNIRCPEGRPRLLRARAQCGYGRYTCLFDTRKGMYTEICNRQDIAPQGRKYVITGNKLNYALCVSDRYQPFYFITTEESHCVYKKEMCNNEGQVVYNNGSAVHNRRCRCDHTKGYSFREDVCSCNPAYEDCSCYTTRCRKGYILSPDYACVLTDEYSNQRFLCTDVPVAKNNLKDRIEKVLFQSKTERKIKELSKKGKLKVCIGASSLIFVLLGVFGVFYCFKRRIKYVKSQPEMVISNIISPGTNQTESDDIEMDDSLYEAIDEHKRHTLRIETENNPTLGLNEDINSSTDDDGDRSSYLNPYNSLLKEPSDYHIYEKI